MIVPLKRAVRSWGWKNTAVTCSFSASVKAPLMSALVVSGSETSELPFEKPTEFKLAINLRTARSIGVPPALLARADEVIECKKTFATMHCSKRHSYGNQKFCGLQARLSCRDVQAKTHWFMNRSSVPPGSRQARMTLKQIWRPSRILKWGY